MAATVSEAAAALKTALGTITGLRVVDYLPDQVNPPTALVGIDTVNYHGAFRNGDATYTYTVTVVVSRASERTAQQKLDAFLSATGATSVRAAIEADPTLGGVIQTCVVPTAGNIQVLNINDVMYLTVDFTVTVHA